MKKFEKPIMIYTSTVNHNIDDVDQCSVCGVLDDPHNMDEVDGKAICIECSHKQPRPNLGIELFSPSQ